MKKNSSFGKTLNYVRRLKTGNHGVFFYKSRQEKREVLFSFLEAGIKKGKAAVYIASQETSKQILRKMKDFGLSVNVLERDGVLKVLDYDSFYMTNGQVDIPRIRMLGKRWRQNATEIGLDGLYACGEVACFFEHNKEKELIEHEIEVGRELDFPTTAMCAYYVNHAKSLDEKSFLSLMKAHGPVVTSSFGRKVKFENFFPAILNEVLEEVFGEPGRASILRTLDEVYAITPHNISENLGALTEAFEELFGSSAQVITKLVKKKIESKIGIAQSTVSIRDAY